MKKNKMTEREKSEKHVRAFRKDNDNGSNGRIQNQDMLWYLVNRVDNIHDKFERMERYIDKKLDKKAFYAGISAAIGVTTIIVTLLVTIVR